MPCQAKRRNEYDRSYRQRPEVQERERLREMARERDRTESARQWRFQNPEKLQASNARRRKLYAANKDEINRKRRERRQRFKGTNKTGMRPRTETSWRPFTCPRLSEVASKIYNANYSSARRKQIFGQLSLVPCFNMVAALDQQGRIL